LPPAASLNKEQSKAVTHGKGPLLIAAGPGSGKTRVLIERVIHLHKNGLKPSEILCLTFSEKAAEEMKQRLEKEGMDITEMDISTFHSFAKDILEDNVLDSGVGISSGVIKRSAQLVWGLKNIDGFGLQHLEIGNNAVEVIESLIDGISTFKDEMISPRELEQYVERKIKQAAVDDMEKDALGKLSDLCRVYYKYQEFQRSKAVIDFDDMVVQAAELLKRKPSVLAKYHKRYRHVLVDEFQDNNYAQLELVKLVAKTGNVTAVGDDDQSIYRFQGAYLTNFQDFKEHFAGTTVIALSQNYRSTKNIVDVAGKLLSGVPDRQEKKLFTENEEGEKVVVAACSTEGAEVEFAVTRIKEMVGTTIKRRDGTESPLTYRDFVILARRKMEGRKFVKALKAYGIPTVYAGEANIFAAPVIKDLMAYLRIAGSPTKAGVEITRLMKRHGLTEQNIARINHAAKERARDDPTDMDFVLDTLRNCNDLGVTQRDECSELAEQVQKVCELESRVTIGEFVYKVMMSLSDLYKRSIQKDTPENRRNQLLLKEMYGIAIEYESLNPQGTLEDFVKYLTLMEQFDLELEEGQESKDAVQVSTIHQSKGREFPVVFVADVAANKLPARYQSKEFYVPNDLSKGVKRKEDEKELFTQEERRLFYVAMTRAQNQLFVLYAKKYGQNVRESKPSKFLDEVEFTSNPRVQVVQFDGTKSEAAMQAEDRLERIKEDLQEKAARAVNQMQLKSAVQRIIELAKVKHFEERGTVEGFDPLQVLQVDSADTNLDLELQGKKAPLINRDELKLSASKIETYLECPLKFKFAHVLAAPEPPRTYFDLGTAVHAVAEHLTRLETEEGQPPTPELAMQLLAREWSSSAFTSETQENQHRENARDMVRTYLRWLEANPNRPVAVEKKFSLEIGGVPFNGLIDRVEKTPEGEYEIVDFKTGRAYKTAKTLREDPQVNIYALAVEKLYGKLPARASLFYLKEDKMVPYEISAEQVGKVRQEVEQVTADILAEKFDATPSFEACRNCPYWDLCDSKKTEE
jgi:DNA helicase-2/ATP-dependent DNA helicase PcrA